MVCQRDCFNCGSEENVSWREDKKEYFCDDCIEVDGEQKMEYKKTIERVVIKLCKNLPLDITLYEEKGFCKKPNKDCGYCRKNKNDYLCNKKTYTLNQELIFVN